MFSIKAGKQLLPHYNRRQFATTLTIRADFTHVVSCDLETTIRHSLWVIARSLELEQSALQLLAS